MVTVNSIDNGVIVIEDNKLLKVATEKDIKIDQYKNRIN